MKTNEKTAREQAHALFNELIATFKRSPNSAYRVYAHLKSKGHSTPDQNVRAEFESLLPHMFDVEPSMVPGDLSVRLLSKEKLRIQQFTTIENFLDELRTREERTSPIVPKRTNLTMSNTPSSIKNELPAKTSKRIIKLLIKKPAHGSTLFELYQIFKHIDRNHLKAAIDGLVDDKCLTQPQAFSFFGKAEGGAFDTVYYHLTEKGEKKYQLNWKNGWLTQTIVGTIVGAIIGGYIGFKINEATDSTQQETKSQSTETASIDTAIQKPITIPSDSSLDTTKNQQSDTLN